MPRPRKNPNDPKWQTAGEPAQATLGVAPEQESTEAASDNPKAAVPFQAPITINRDINDVRSMNIYEKLLKIEEEIGTIQKTGKNESLKYSFIEQAQIVARLTPLFTKYRVKVLVSEIAASVTAKDGYDPKAGAVVPRGAKATKHVRYTFVNIDNPSEQWSGDFFSEGDDSTDKASNKASTANQKYFYIRNFNITDQDPDELQPEEGAPEKGGDKIKPDKATKIYTMLGRMGTTVEEYEEGLTAHYGKPTTVKDLTNAEADQIITQMVAEITRIMNSKQEA